MLSFSFFGLVILRVDMAWTARSYKSFEVSGYLFHDSSVVLLLICSWREEDLQERGSRSNSTIQSLR